MVRCVGFGQLCRVGSQPECFRAAVQTHAKLTEVRPNALQSTWPLGSVRVLNL